MIANIYKNCIDFFQNPIKKNKLPPSELQGQMLFPLFQRVDQMHDLLRLVV